MKSDSLVKKTVLTTAVMVGGCVLLVGTISTAAMAFTSAAVHGQTGAAKGATSEVTPSAPGHTS